MRGAPRPSPAPNVARWPAVLLLVTTLVAPIGAGAQIEARIDPPDDKAVEGDLGTAPNTIDGDLSPGRGFDLVKTELGSLNISFYGLARYLNQGPSGQRYRDHLGREHPVRTRNDINWHRTMIWFSGFMIDPRLRYTITVWSLPTTQQTLAFGNLRFRFNRALTLAAGIGPTLTARSMQGSHPFWASSDRQMGEEFFRGGFASGIWATGEPIPRLFYDVSINTNLSQLGVTAANDSRSFAYSASVWWLPTTGEYGLRGGVPDFEEHETVATRFGFSVARAREDRAAELSAEPRATQIRLSDGQFLFAEGALATGVTVQRATYRLLQADAGMKYRGLTLHAEYFVRQLSDFAATGSLPMSDVLDHGFFGTVYYMVVPKLVGAYVSGSYVFDEFRRHPWEISLGASVFPFASRSWRLNLHFIYVERSPTGSNFGFYTAGQTGPTLSIGTDILL